jgi:hypothetical protein
MRCPQRKLSGTLVFGGASFINKLYKVGARTELRGTPTCISLGVDNFPSTVTLKLWLTMN